ncbi:MAG TPA: RHS repeat-associated core domain-containing protein, partial [Chthoniobacterales bacterium]|nr:RHS repeat-associated core domain-containing protein [Chthoniobacterales bacterium]
MNRLKSVDRAEDGLRDAFSYYLNGELSSATYGSAIPAPTPTPTPTPVPTATPSPTAPPHEPPCGRFCNIINSPTQQQQSQRNVLYDYDKSGNRTNLSDTGGMSYVYSTNILNQYEQTNSAPAFGVINGPQHEIAAYQNANYAYINDAHLTRISGLGVSGQTATYEMNYDALGRCVVRVLNGIPSYYIYDGERPILEYAGSSYQLVAANVYGKGIDEILRRTDYVANRTLYYQSDHQGSITHVTDAAGNVIESYRYDAFGAPSISSASGITTNNRFMFTGREYVPEFGIYEYRARAYHPGLGRFMSEDPKGFGGGDYNLFRYCNNDPVDLTDPMGLQSKNDPRYPDPEDKTYTQDR